jgi:hypothetical protein
MLLVAGNRSLRLYGQDINARCCAATLINGALYCPWIAFPFPEGLFEAPTSGFSTSHEVEKEEAEPAPIPRDAGGQGRLFAP